MTRINPRPLVLPTLALLLLGIAATDLAPNASAQDRATAVKSPKELAIVWTSGDPEVAHRMVLMYGHGAQKAEWFDQLRIIVWGPSARLLAADKDLQAKIKQMKADGVIVQACVVCADSYGVADQLRKLDIEVKGMGQPLSKFIKDPATHVLTF